MSCVNKSSREFKALAANNNISANTLELITHKYWIETGSEENLPSDVYIQAQLGNHQYKETIPEVRELWKKRYSNPRTYTSYEELQDAYKRALQYFPQDAVVYYKDRNGNYVLSVKQPVEEVANTATDFFSKKNTNTKTLDLGLNENQTYGIDKVEELFNRFNTDRTSKNLAEKVFKIAKDLGLQVSFSNDIPFGMTGRYTNNNTITYRKSFLERDANTGKKAPLLLHEVIHALTVYAISDDRVDVKKSKSLRKFQTDINRIFNEVRFNKALKGERGIESVREFVAELANPIFRQKLQSIDANKKRSVWNRIVDAIKSFLGIHPSSTYYQRSMNALDKALNAFDIDAYLAYNDMKSPLQQAYNEHRIDFENMSEEELKSLLKDAIKEGSITLNRNTKLNKDEADRLSLSQRFSQEELRGSNGILKAAEACLQRGSYSSVPEDSQSVVGVKREGKEAVIAKKQEVILEDWAKGRKIWFSNTTDTLEKKYGKPFAQEGEADVYFSNDGTKVIKQIRLDYYVEPQLLLDRVVLHNYLFPETALTLTNLGRSKEGDFVIVAEQPYVKGEKPSKEEINTFITSLGFEPSENSPSEYINKEHGLYISDLHDENVIKAGNAFFVIDADIRINTANYGFGGTRTTKGVTAQLSSFIDSMSKEQIVNELKKIRQEYSDYDLISDDSEEVQQRRKKNTFTFNDGTTVSTPFTPNSQQAEALNVMNDFIHSNNETTMTLSGYAGTGKTSLMEIIAKKARRDGKLIMFSATTNKATAVLKSKVSKIGFDAQTLNKVFGINVEVDTNSTYDARNLVNKLRDAEIPYGTIVVIDEASMINEENYRILNNIAKENHLKIIYVGDRAQLAPVNENKVSKVFRNSDGKVIELTKVERTDDNAILKEATNIRNGRPMSMESSFNDEGKGVAFINPKGEHRQAIIDVIKHYVQGLKKDPNYFRILAYTNKAVSQYNNFVRKQLGYTDNVPHVGEPIVGYANWGYDWHTKTYDFINSESYKVTKVGTQKERSFEVGGQKVRMTVVPITLEDSLGRQKTFDFMDIKGNSANRAAAEILATMKKMLWAKARTASKAAKRDIYAQINAIDRFLFVNDNITDSQGHYLQTKTFDFGYALTIHKSQGSTFTNVLMDDNDISKAHDDVTRDTDEYSGNWEINLEDGSLTPASDDASITHASDDEIAHTRQQLEYVAMSRATDTITVIADNAKKEDSPLNHLKGKKSNNSTTETMPTEAPQQTQNTAKYSWGRYPQSGKSSYEVSSRGDRRFSALNATFKDGTKWKGTDISGKTVEWVYQNLIKKSRKGQPPAKDSILYNESLSTKAEREDYSYEKGYLPLWQLWASQHQEEIQDLAEKAKGKVLTDMFASTRVSQARALAEILNTSVSTINDNNNSLDNKGNNNGQQEIQQGELVQPTLSGNLEINWQSEGSRGNNSRSQSEQTGRGNNTSGIRGNDADVAKQVEQVSNALNQRLADKGITATKQKVRKAASQEFHDAITKAKEQNSNGWMVDVHDTSDYDNDLCMITEDGKSGIAVTKNGDIVSVFSAVSKDHRLDKLMQMAIAAGGKKLDCYYLSANNILTGLPVLYAKYGFKVDSVTPFDEQYAPEEYKEWQKNNPDRKVEGVAAMSLKVADSIEGYSKDNTPDIEQAPSFATYEEMLNYRDSHKVKLSGYEYFTESYEDTTVDAAWKIPQLQELDAQLSNDNTPEQNQEIINKMNDILKASVEEDIKETSSKKEEQIQQNLDEYDKLNNQIDNLLDGHFDPNGVFSQGEDVNIKDLDIKFTASEIRHLSELIGNYISDMITRLQTEKGAEKELFPQMKFKDDTDFTQMSRQQIVETVGINSLIERAKFDFAPENEVIDYDNTDVMVKANLALENWDALMLLASDTLALNEGFSVSRNYDKGNFDLNTGNSQVAYDDFNNYQDEDTIQEEQGDAQEYWQIESRTIDVLNSMSALVRQGLHECYVLDKDGNRVLDEDWRLPLRVNPRKATNSILRWTQGSLNLEDMIAKLQAKQGDNPWVQQLIERLSDRSGKETDFQSQFYGVFSKPFQLYSIVLTDGGKYASIPVNSHPALSEAMNSITALYKMGEHPLFTESGKIKAELLGSDNTVADSNNFNLHQALSNMRTIYDRIKHGEELDAEMTKEAAKWLTGVYKVLGYNVTEEMVSDVLDKNTVKNLTEKLGYMVKSLDNALQTQKRNAGNPNVKPYQPFAFGAENNIGGTLRNFLTPITDSLEDTAVSAFYDSGKMYQSYVTPSFMTKLMNKFKLSGERFEEFIMNEYGNSEWFRSQKYYGIDRGWRNGMLNLLARDPNARQVFDFKVELNFNKHNYMRNMTPNEYTLSLITEYFAESADIDGMVPAWFRMPMQSNKPSSEFFKFYSYRDPSTYKDTITDQLYNMFLQECDRIQTVRMRNFSKSDNAFIKNFDSNGKKFNFLPFLNSYLDNSANSKAQRTLLRNADNTVSSDNDTLASLLQRRLEGLEETKLSSDEMATLNVLVEKAIRNYMENMAQRQLSQWENEGIIEAARSVKNIVPHDDLLEGNGKEEDKDKYVRQSLENYIWNDYLASKNILQLTVGDIAFYKDAEDLQKRLSQLHAPGIRGNIAATDYDGNAVTDGKYRTIILKDWDNFISNVIDNISEAFDRKIADAPENQKAQMIALKESLVGENGAYRNINVADAQGYSSPSSYRKKAFIFGKWSRHSEEVYQKLLKGEYNYTDLQTAFQPLKPFVYTHLEKNLGVDNAPIHTMHVPFQAKNSEYLLIMADAIMKGDALKGGKLSRPNLLRAVYRVMEESERLNPTKGIDTVQFESAIKSGLQGAMDIHQFADMAGGEEAAYTFMMSQIYKENNGQRTNDYNTDVFVHEASYEDYCLQQEVPEHFKDHSQAHGSQIRMITPSDLDYYVDPNRVDKDAEDNINYYEWTEPDGTKRRLKADKFRKEYEKTIADNIEESLNSLQQELHLDSNDMRERNIALSKILQREILSSPRYGVDLLQACSVDKKTGEFRIPKGDPIQAKRIEQLINSIIKNRVNKQKIAGGPIVQVTNFGTSRQLHIRFNDRQGGILKTKDEFLKDDNLVSQYKTYEKYCKERQAGIAYFEVFLPMWSNELFEKFADENGNIDMEAVENADPELTRMVSYRIPTEDKYSTAPMKAVGFMPREAGDAIMLPYDLTTIDDSDFDVDKRYVMRKEIPIKTKPKYEIVNALFRKVEESYNRSHKEKLQGDDKRAYRDAIDVYVSAKLKGSHKSGDRYVYNGKDYTQLINYLDRNVYRKVAYTTERPTSGRLYRNNKIVDMTLAVLTNEKSADKVLNPGGFEDVARTGYMIAAYRSPQAIQQGITWEQLQSMSEDELKDLSYVSKDLAEIGTQIQFYKQNSSTSSMIGIFAVSKVAHAVLEGNGIFLDINEVVGQPFTIAGTTFDGRMEIDVKYDTDGNLVGKTAGSLVSASADGVKKPVLDLMNVNTTTAGVLNTMLRLGMPFRKAALFMSQDVIGRTLRQFNTLNLSNYVPLSKVITDAITEFENDNEISDDSNIRTEELTEEELREGTRPTEHKATDYKVLLALQKLMDINDAMRNPTFATRFNSISSAVGPLIIDNLILEHKIDNFKDSNSENGTTHFYDRDGVNVDIDDIFFDHPVLKQFARTVDIAKDIFKDMPAGSEKFRQVLATLPSYIKERVYGDKKLLSGLSDFFQSYMLIASGLIDPKELKYYINEFPKEFSKENYKEKYPDNALIQAIKVNVSRKTNRPFLQLSTTGMDTQQKEELSSAWIDLHKENPELSRKLFIYNFFRAGIGFSPKTFMSLVPMYVKEHLSMNDTTYVDTFRNMPDIVPNILIDQFIRNNWSNNKLVPWKGGKGRHYSFDYKQGRVELRNPDDIKDMGDTLYFKTKGNGQTHLWRRISADENILVFKEINPLGDNGEYLEMSRDNLKDSLSHTSNTEEDNAPSSLLEDNGETPVEHQETKAEQKKESDKVLEFVDLLAKQNPRLKGENGINKYEDIKKNPKLYGGFLVNVFKQKGLTLDRDQAIEEFKKYC